MRKRDPYKGIPRGDRDYDSRAVLRAVEMNLDAGRLSPETVKANIKALEEIRDGSKDPRARNKAISLLMDWQKWMTEYERPIAQEVNHNHAFPTAIEIKTTHTHRLADQAQAHQERLGQN